MAKIFKDDAKTSIGTLDKKGNGNAFHEYKIIARDIDEIGMNVISFQNGPIKEYGVNGCTNEDLLEIVRHRLQCFQEGDFKCRENASALTKIEEALHWLNHRTQDRIKRNVEGVNKL